MSMDDESTTTQPKPRYQQWNNTWSFEPISLSSRFLWRYYQVFTMPPSFNITPTKNSSSGYTTSTIHQSPFGGLINRVCLLLHQLSHHHHIFYCKLLPLHPYTPWRSTVLLGEMRSSVEGQVPFLWRSSRQLPQLWFVNWSSNVALITRGVHIQTICPLCAQWSIGCL